MGINQYLIIGGSGEAGQSAIEELKRIAPEATIIASTSEYSNIPGADFILTGIKAMSELEKKIRTQLDEKGLPDKFKAIIYTPALGEVGYPIKETSISALKTALSISYDPMLALEEEFRPDLTVGYSAFYWLDHTLTFYGSMGYVKLKMDQWALSSPEKRRIVRARTFLSKSVRGISIILQRTMKKTEDPQLLKLKTAFETSGKKFQEFFLDYAWMHEKEHFLNSSRQTSYRPTIRTDLARGLSMALSQSEPIATVLGDWSWTENRLPNLPDWFDESKLK